MKGTDNSGAVDDLKQDNSSNKKDTLLLPDPRRSRWQPWTVPKSAAVLTTNPSVKSNLAQRYSDQGRPNRSARQYESHVNYALLGMNGPTKLIGPRRLQNEPLAFCLAKRRKETIVALAN